MILDKFNDFKHTENTQFRLGDFTFAVFFSHFRLYLAGFYY